MLHVQLVLASSLKQTYQFKYTKLQVETSLLILIRIVYIGYIIF